jgi:hypothetical protein
VTIATGWTLRTGIASYRFKPTTRGTATLRIVVPATSTRIVGTSRSLTLKAT